MAKWLAKEFDWTLGKYTGNYYNIAEAGIVSVFVDSYNGSDTNDGTPLTPFKTLSKAITVLNSTGGNGSRIFMNGIFSETLPAQTYWYEFIGCGGGYNGRTVFVADYLNLYVINIRKDFTRWQNVNTLNYDNSNINYTTFFIQNTNNIKHVYFANCLLLNLRSSSSSGFGHAYHCYYTYLKDCLFFGVGTDYYGIHGQNNTINNVSSSTTTRGYRAFTANSHWFNMDTLVDSGVSNILNVDGQYFDIENNNLNLQSTSPLLFAGTPDPQTGIKSHVGAGVQGFKYNGLSNAFTTLGGAVLTNLETDEFGKLRRINTAENGNVISGVIDLGNTYPITNIDVHNVFEYGVSGVTMGVFDNITTPRGVLTIKIKYGLILTDIDICPWLKIEYGKQPTYSGSNTLRVGNGDDTFDETDINNISARFLQFNVSLKDITI